MSDQRRQASFESRTGPVGRHDHGNVNSVVDHNKNGTILVSVIIPALNVAQKIGAQLEALGRQSYEGAWEVVVVDNASRDETVAVVEDHLDRFPQLKVVSAPRLRSSAYARNVGARAAVGELLLFCDADDVVTPGWVAALVRALEDAPLATGPIDHASRNGPAVLPFVSELGNDEAPLAYGFLSYALTANLGVRRAVFESLGGFRPGFRSANDVEFSWRAQLAGHELKFEPKAAIERWLPARPWELCRKHVRDARLAPLLYRKFDHLGMQRSSTIRALGEWSLLLLRSPEILLSSRRWAWMAKTSHRFGRFAGSIRYRTRYL